MDEEVVNPFKQKAAADAKRREEEKLRKEQEAAAAKAAKAAKAKQSKRTAEDDWFFDDATGETPGSFVDDHDDDEAGFQMLDLQQAPDASADRRASADVKPLKLTSLIDFDECNVAVDETVPSQGTPGWSGADVEGPAPSFSQNSMQSASAAKPDSRFSGSGDQALLAELQHLQQRLADAEEEKQIQLSIVQDENSSLKQEVKDVTAERDSLRVELERLRAQNAAGRAVANDHTHENGNAAKPPKIDEVQSMEALAGSRIMDELQEIRQAAERQLEFFRQRFTSIK